MNPVYKKVLLYAAAVLFFAALSCTFVPQAVFKGEIVQSPDITGYVGASHEAKEWDEYHPEDKTAWTGSMFGGMPTILLTGNDTGDWVKPLFEAVRHAGRRPASYLFISLLGAFLGGGDFSSISGLSGSNSDFLFGRSLSNEETADYIAANHFDPSALTWQESGGSYVIHLSDEQWSMVEGLALNVFLDDGQGFLDLGLDAVFEFDDNGDLLAPAEPNWVAINNHPVAYYHEYAVDGYYYGYTPALLNGERVELQICFDPDGNGTVTGIRTVYEDDELLELPKTQTELGEAADLENPSDADAETTIRLLQPGDVLDFLCDCYHYDGTYENTYKLGAQLVIGSDGVRVANVPFLATRLISPVPRTFHKLQRILCKLRKKIFAFSEKCVTIPLQSRNRLINYAFLNRRSML